MQQSEYYLRLYGDASGGTITVAGHESMRTFCVQSFSNHIVPESQYEHFLGKTPDRSSYYVLACPLFEKYVKCRVSVSGRRNLVKMDVLRPLRKMLASSPIRWHSGV